MGVLIAATGKRRASNRRTRTSQGGGNVQSGRLRGRRSGEYLALAAGLAYRARHLIAVGVEAPVDRHDAHAVETDGDGHVTFSILE